MLELGGIVVLGIVAQWFAWKLKIPAILPLILIGLFVVSFSSCDKIEDLCGKYPLNMSKSVIRRHSNAGIIKVNGIKHVYSDTIDDVFKYDKYGILEIGKKNRVVIIK